MVLLSAELISKTSGVNHRLLGLLLGVLGSAQHGVDLSLDGVDGALKSALGVFLMFLIEALAAGVSKKWSKTRYLPSSGRGGWDVTAVMIYSGYALVQIVVVGR